MSREWMNALWLRITTLLRRRQLERDLDDELQFHLAMREEKLAEQGVSPEEAHYAARRAFGNATEAKEMNRAMWTFSFLGTLWQDIRYGLRQLRRNPGFAVVTVVTLALGIGASTAIFSVIYNGVLNPFPYKDADRLITFSIYDLQHPSEPSDSTLPLPEFLDYRRQSRAFEGMSGGSGGGLPLISVICRQGSSRFELTAGLLTANSLEFYGVRPLLGRWFTPEDTKAAATPVFVMSYKTWRGQFGGDPKILGRTFTFALHTITLGPLVGVPRTLIGIMPRRFRVDRADLWIPLALNKSQVSDDPVLSEIDVSPVAQLREGVSIQAATAELNVIAHHLASIYPKDYPRRFVVRAATLRDGALGGFKAVTYLLFGVVALLLFIACSNVANLLLTRGTVRDKEIAIRAAAGASPGRLIRQLVVENVTLAALACLAGCLLAYWGIKELVRFIPVNTFPQEAVIELNPAALLFALITSVIVVLLCGLAPAMHSVRDELQSRLSGVITGAGLRHRRLRSGLVIAEVALSLVLLIGAGLMMRTFFAITHVDLGFNPNNLLMTEMHLPQLRTPEEKSLFFSRVLRRVMSLPGVTAAAEIIAEPPGPGAVSDVTVLGASHSEAWKSMYDFVSASYFQTLGLRLVRGRLMTDSEVDSTQHVAVVNRALAQRFFGTGDPIGRKIKFDAFDRWPRSAHVPHNAYFEIIGVVSDFRNDGLKNPPMPEAFLPCTLLPYSGGIIIRTALDGNLLTPAMLRQIWKVDPSAMPVATGTPEDFIQENDYARPEFELVTLGTFAGIGLMLVAIGVFSVMAYFVSLCTHEIGIRMAPGAQRGDVLRMVLRNGVRLLAVGLGFGLLVSIALMRLLDHLVWGVSVTDPWTFGAAAATILAFGLLACYIPARRATKVDPMVALRYE